MNRKLYEMAQKERRVMRKNSKAPIRITLIELNRANSGWDYGESNRPLAKKQNEKRNKKTQIHKNTLKRLTRKRKMRIARQACPKSRLKSLVKFQMCTNGGSKQLWNNGQPQSGHAEGFLPRIISRRSSVESLLNFKDVWVWSLQRFKSTCLPRLERKPKWRIFEKPLGRTCIKNLRINSSADRFITFCLFPSL